MPLHERSLDDLLTCRDAPSWAELYGRLAPGVHQTAWHVTRSVEGAHEVTQDVFVMLWNQAQAFDAERGTLRAWINTIVRRRAIDWVRREHAAQHRDSLATPSGAAPDDVEQLAINGVLAHLIGEAIAALPPAQREILELVYRRGLSYRQAAVALGIPEGTAKARIRQGLMRLAASLAQLDPEAAAPPGGLASLGAVDGPVRWS